MGGSLEQSSGEHRAVRVARGWRGFRRARQALWGVLALLIAVGALLHEALAHSLLARLLWIGAVVVLVGLPLRHLFGFRCPRCGGIYLATGTLRDFMGLGRILWGSRCGGCSLPAGHPRRPNE